MPDEITFTRLDNEKATLKTRVGERIPPAISGCPPDSTYPTCFFEGWAGTGFWNGDRR